LRQSEGVDLAADCDAGEILGWGRQPHGPYRQPSSPSWRRR